MIREAGLKQTEHRLCILTRVSKSKSPIVASKLIEDIKKKYHIDQATVYRNLTALENAGLINKFSHSIIGSNSSHAHYEMVSDDVYSKVMCSNCETIEKVHGISTDELSKKISKKSKHFKTSNVLTLELYALCKSCT